MIGALFFQIICIGISDSLSSQSSRAYAGAGGKMVQKTTAITDCDQLLVSGVYYIHQEILNAPFGYAFIVVFQSPLEPSELVQVAYGLYLEQKKRTKIKDRGWSEWR